MPETISLDRMVKVLKALAHPTRIKILEVVSTDAGSVTTVAAAARVSPSVASQWLTTLRKAGLVEKERIGAKVYYRARKDTLPDLVRSVLVVASLPPPPEGRAASWS